MSPRRNRRGRGPAPAALFTWGPHGADIQPGEARDNPLTRKCRACGSNPGERCTRPSRGGRKPIDSYHNPGRNPPPQVDQEPPENPPSVPPRATGDP
jgi:hypothetical protein